MPASAAKRPLRQRARAQVARVLDEALSVPLEALDDRLRRRASAAPYPGMTWITRERLHDVLRNDRNGAAQTEGAAAAAAPANAGVADLATQAAAKPAAAAAPRLHGTCDEPIRTRSMARLLAKQGRPDRALAIYEALIALDPADAALRSELEATRALVASGGDAPAPD